MSQNHETILDFICDGYSERALVKAVPRIHGDFRFRFRPMLVADKNQILESAQKKPAKDADRILAAAMKVRLEEWSLTDRSGNSVPITESNILRLKPQLFNKLFWIIAGTEASDPDPELSDSDKDRESDLLLQAAIEGQAIGEIREALDEKNSVAGLVSS